MRTIAEVSLQELVRVRRRRLQVPLQQDEVPLHRHRQHLQRRQRLLRRRQFGRVEM